MLIGLNIMYLLLPYKVESRVQLDFPVDFLITREVIIKSRINWNDIDHAFNSIIWRDIYNTPCPIPALNLRLLDMKSRIVPVKNLEARSHDKAWFNDRCRQAYRNLWSNNCSHLC